MASPVPLPATMPLGATPGVRRPTPIPADAPVAASPGRPAKELASRDDVAFESLIDQLRCTNGSLAISIKTCRRSSDNPVFRMSADQQFETGLAHVTALLGLESVAYAEEQSRTLAREVQPFLDIVAQITWGDAAERVTKAFALRVADLFAPERLRRDGRPAPALTALLATRTRIPEPAPHEAPAPAAAVDEIVVLHETLFTHGDGSHQHLVGRMFLAFMVHVRNMSAEEAARNLSPAALMGFETSLEQALAGHAGPVAFRIVRRGAAVEPQLHRLATP